MLDSLGSTLSAETIDAFFTARGKDPATDELTVAEAVQSLEHELFRPEGEKKRIDSADYRPALELSVPQTPALGGPGAAPDNPLGSLDFAGPPGEVPVASELEAARKADPIHRADPPAPYTTEHNQQPLVDVLANPPKHTPMRPAPERHASSSGSEAEDAAYSPGWGSTSASASPWGSTSASGAGSRSGSGSGGTSPGGADSPTVERVINVKTCPLCHRPRMNKKGEVDIVTHLAICASQDWERVDRIVVGNFVTSSQAQRKWMAKVIGKVARGAYQLGAVRALCSARNRAHRAAELGKHHHPEPDDGPARGGEDAGPRAARHPNALQGVS
jgi:phosphatidylserine decarboxylase